MCLPLSWGVFHGELPGWITAAVAAVSGPVAVLGGKSALSTLDLLAARGQGKRWFSVDMAVTVATIVFATVLFAALARLEYLHGGRPGRSVASEPGWGARVAAHIAIALALGAALWFTSGKINANRFSLHALYRNRLAREFLGAANAGRAPHPFTGFDARDNVRMHQLRADDGKPILFPVVNLTLNVTEDQKRLAWQERKAAPFTVTPLACGSAMLDADPNGASPQGAFVDSRCYAGVEPDQDQAAPEGLTLATAMTISGAAVSPSMGYNSSPATAFLMTLFNVRLGAWLPNPAYAMRLAAQTAERVKGLRVVAERSGPAAKAQAREETRAWRFSAASGPRYAIAPLMDELLGRAGTESQFVYLSDGGHFENLGIYEMVRRRCRYILVSDAGCDPECAFADLGNAVRKIAIDLHVPITFERIRITARGKCGKDTVGFALARIAYPEAGGDKSKHGWLLYIKPTYLEDLPVDVRAYAAAHGDFPHETTTDQWFSESQFESYRQLGEFLAGSLARRRDLREFFAGLRAPRPRSRPYAVAAE